MGLGLSVLRAACHSWGGRERDGEIRPRRPGDPGVALPRQPD